MVSIVIWCVANFLLALLLYRAFKEKLLAKYPLLYLYIGVVLLRDLISFYLFLADPAARQIFYWYTQFLLVALEYGIIWEIYIESLANYRGACRLARSLLSFLYVIVAAKVLVASYNDSFWSLAETTAILERNLRAMQAMLLLALVGLLAYYAIPLGRNLRGMIFGYGLFVGTSVINLTLRAYIGDGFQVWWQYLQPTANLVTLGIWCVSLWSYYANPQPKKPIELDDDYELLAARMAKAMARARNYLVKAASS